MKYDSNNSSNTVKVCGSSSSLKLAAARSPDVCFDGLFTFFAVNLKQHRVLVVVCCDVCDDGTRRNAYLMRFNRWCGYVSLECSKDFTVKTVCKASRDQLIGLANRNKYIWSKNSLLR